MTRSRAETLGYATPEIRAGVPLREIVGASLAFAGANWVATFASDWWYFVGRRKLSADAGEAAAQLSVRWGKLAWNMVPETFWVAVAGMVVLLVQWWAWRVWAVGRRRTWPVAAVGGVGQCAGVWGLWWLSEDGLGWAGFGAVVGMATGVGLILAWWRGR